RVLPWLKKQIDNIRALGGDTDQIAKLEAYQVRFEAFIVIPVKKIDRLAQEPILSETPEWNREIAFTFDDSLAGSAAIISHLESQGITNYRFYGEAGTAIKDGVLLRMGVAKKRNGKPNLAKTTDKVTPGKWLEEFVDIRRGNSSRKQYIREQMIKSNYLLEGKKIKHYYQEKYPENWLQKIQENFHYHAGILHPISDDRRNHIQYWNEDQIVADIEFFQEFMKAWLDIDEYTVSRLRPPMGGGFGYDKEFGKNTGTKNAQKMIDAAKQVNSQAQWDLWTSDSFDAATRGRWNQRGKSVNDSVRDIVVHRKTGKGRIYEPKEASLLFHTQYYKDSQQKLDQFVDGITHQILINKVVLYPKELQSSAKLVKRANFWGKNGNLICSLSKNETCVVIGERGGGYFVKLSNGTRGFIAKKFIEKKEDVASKYNLPRTVQGKEVVYEFGKWTPEKIQKLISALEEKHTQEEKMMTLYKKWKDIPYKKRLSASLKQGYKNLKVVEPYKDKFVIRLDAMDCTEFPIYALAVMGADSYETFVQRLISIKYKQGVIDDQNKLHYTYMRFQDWEQSNIVHNIDGELAGNTKSESRRLTTISNRLDKVPKRYTFIPRNNIDKVGNVLKTGDVFGFVLSDSKIQKLGYDTKTRIKREQIIGHMGFVFNEDGIPYFIHSNASRYHNGQQAGVSIAEEWDAGAKKLHKGSKRKISDYIKENPAYKGIIVMRPNFDI
ncbi:DUF1460 domain-containing protein, partial [Candidatus Gracilibacteria bacterium]|nr:DUF1460 domain-containing protein [Candidatus Gracilibacteria bacterium]